MAKLTKLQTAQALALRGETDAAIAAFLDLKKKGNVGASASLAELLAFRGKWNDVMTNVEAVLATPTSVEAVNVYTDMIGLAALAIASLHKWEEGAELASMALDKVSTLRDYEDHTIIVHRLLEFIERRGEGAIFGDRDYFAIGEPSEPLEERRSSFDSAIAELQEPRSRPTPDNLEHMYALAETYGYHEGAVQIFDRERGRLPREFNDASFVASALARAGRHTEAWNAIEKTLSTWWPVVLSQVAPVELLLDGALRTIMTPERCEEVLRCPRGSEAQQN